MHGGISVHLDSRHKSCQGICPGKPSGPISEEEIDGDGKWFWDLKCSLVELFYWSLYDIDRTDIESLVPFVFHYPVWKARFHGNGPPRSTLYADQVSWL